MTWVEHSNEFGRWWIADGNDNIWVEEIDGLFYTYDGPHAYKTLRGVQRFVERRGYHPS